MPCTTAICSMTSSPRSAQMVLDKHKNRTQSMQAVKKIWEYIKANNLQVGAAVGPPEKMIAQCQLTRWQRPLHVLPSAHQHHTTAHADLLMSLPPLQDPKNKRNIICDDKMRTIFTPPINMFSMNKQLSKHVKASE